jgi:hypothetical protein
MYHQWYTTEYALTGYVLPLLNALLLIHQSGSQIACAIGFTFNGLVTHVSKLAKRHEIDLQSIKDNG